MKQRAMKARPIPLLQMAAMAAFFAGSSLATQHVVGDSIWTIPPSNDFYSNWSRNKSFIVGDSLGENVNNFVFFGSSRTHGFILHSLESENCYVVPRGLPVFRFEMGLYNVMQVSKREIAACSAENPFRTFLTGPATVDLKEEGMLYFICSFGNYCLLGQKLTVSVQRPPPTPPPANSSSPASP